MLGWDLLCVSIIIPYGPQPDLEVQLRAVILAASEIARGKRTKEENQ